MPQVLVMVLVGAGLLAGYKFIRREMLRVADDLREAEAALRRRKDDPPRVSLERDPKTGVYRPKRG